MRAKRICYRQRNWDRQAEFKIPTEAGTVTFARMLFGDIWIYLRQLLIREQRLLTSVGNQSSGKHNVYRLGVRIATPSHKTYFAMEIARQPFNVTRLWSSPPQVFNQTKSRTHFTLHVS